MELPLQVWGAAPLPRFMMNRQFITASLVRMRVDKAFIPADVVVGQGGEVWHAYDQATLLSASACTMAHFRAPITALPQRGSFRQTGK